MIRIAVTLASIAALAGPALAGAPRLKELVAVSSEIVRIGDIVENAGAAADIPVFRAPDLGQTGAVPVARIADALRPHDITGVETGGLTEVVVTRLSRALTGKDITQRIVNAVAGQYGLGEAQNIAVILDRDIRILHVEPNVTSELAVSRMNVDRRTGRFDISFELPGSTLSRRASLRFTGTVTETADAAILTRSLRPGDVIKASDVAMERRPKSEIRGDGISPDQAIGMTVKSPQRSGQALRLDDLAKPQIVQRNEPVTITYQVPGIMLTVRGKATEPGALGDMIGVLNVQSNRTVQGTVIGPGRVSIAANGPLIASVSSSDQPTQ
jgi:flagella basal body P-ring formation protein FlgA